MHVFECIHVIFEGVKLKESSNKVIVMGYDQCLLASPGMIIEHPLHKWQPHAPKWLGIMFISRQQLKKHAFFRLHGFDWNPWRAYSVCNTTR
jgi:hypothetical protein